ncbi:glycoside hydrolase family 43 protein [Fulvivirga ligni]|uniref:glycoside hydrolase family 43 protein n=1 Tax=Fulvivirga ligni TaxID=2904246 RepID=UPI001F1F2A8B|nr:glycoside hydrolase family 43 protein [Fulvivirga ligni]UII21467.1 glycoside hydrolase family 43 protein [Fulvivirga ligni]
MKLRYLLVLVLFPALAWGQSKTFTNPILPGGPDPWVIYKDGYYYYTHTMGRNIKIWKTKNIADIPTAESKVVWNPPAEGMNSKELWAPEIHYLQGKWYVYVAADNGKNINHRMWVLECDSQDPLKGNWTVKGKLQDNGDHWAIDGSVFENNGQLYMVWSGWEGARNGRQDIYISRMKNPWTLEGKRTMISTPTYDWEKHGKVTWEGEDMEHIYVNEGPQPLKHGNKIFIIYSASACWTDYYALGMLAVDNDQDLMNADNWKKSKDPVFEQAPENGVYAPGHNSFFKSADGTEDWILYHANSESGLGCGPKRSPRAQKFTWNTDGTPNFGTPVKEGEELPIPSDK